MNVYQRQSQKQTQYLAQHLRQSLQVLCLNNYDLIAYMQQQQAENPLLEMQEAERDPYVRINFQGECSRRIKRGASMDETAIRELPASFTFQEYLYQQLNVISMTTDEIRAAKLIIGCLDSDGYLRESLENISSISDISLEALRRALPAVQSLDPAGVGSRTLAEYLHRKADSLKAGSAELHELIENHLVHLAARDYETIAKQMNISEQTVRRYSDFIRSLPPSPGNPFVGTQYIVPDIIVSEDNGVLFVSIAKDYIPRLAFNNDYKDFIECADALSPKDRKYIQDCSRSASEVLRSLEMRYQTLELVAKTIVEFQRKFFLGQGPLTPLSMTDVAERIHIHSSTVSRAVSGKYIQCKRGVLSLKSIFSAELSKGSEIVSADAGKEEIKKILKANPKLSDRAISELLLADGIRIARRTVAKYRAQLGIENAYIRSK